MALAADVEEVTYTLEDILINPDDIDQLEENFISDSNRNARIQLKKHGIPECSLIIPDWFYLGNRIDVSDKAFLQKLGITHILNVTDVVPIYFPHDFTYAQIKVDDDPSYELYPYFDAATAFIDTLNPLRNPQNKDHHLKLLVHCAVGKSRSATIVIQYFMRRGVNVYNHQWVDRILSFGMLETLIEDERLYRRSLSCCKCCSCWITCCIGMSCCCCDDRIELEKESMDKDTLDLLQREYGEYGNNTDLDGYLTFVTLFLSHDELGRNESTMSYRNACDYVMYCRDIICPNQAFATQLAEFEEELRNGVSTFTQCQAWEVNGWRSQKISHK